MWDMDDSLYWNSWCLWHCLLKAHQCPKEATKMISQGFPRTVSPWLRSSTLNQDQRQRHPPPPGPKNLPFSDCPYPLCWWVDTGKENLLAKRTVIPGHPERKPQATRTLNKSKRCRNNFWRKNRVLVKEGQDYILRARGLGGKRVEAVRMGKREAERWMAHSAVRHCLSSRNCMRGSHYGALQNWRLPGNDSADYLMALGF